MIGKFSDAGFAEQQDALDQMSQVNTIDWANDESQILAGSQDDVAVLWDAETQDFVSRSQLELFYLPGF